MRRRLAALGLGLVLVAAAGCANIPEQSTPQAEPNGRAQSPGNGPGPNPKADPYTLVRDFIGEAGNPDAAKEYLTEDAKKAWKGDVSPTIIDDTFITAPAPPEQPNRRSLGDVEDNEVTVVLTVTMLGRLGADRAFVPVYGPPNTDRVVVSRASANDPWRIKTPPSLLLITKSDFSFSYQQVSVYFFDPEYRVTVPDLRYVAARPTPGVADRVVRALLDGPSDTLGSAVKTMLGGAELRTNVVSNADGALEINLTKLGDKSPKERELIAAQVVLSLRDVTQGRVKLLADGQQLVPDHGDWRVSDIPSYDTPTRPNPDLPGLYTAPDGKVHILRDGAAVPGPAGNGELRAASAAQSIDGKALAVVREVSTGARLLIGPYGGALPEVDGLQASTLTRPTWLLGNPGSPGSNEVWTVQNGVDVVRVVRTGNDSWAPSQVNASDLKSYGTTISDLRLSRDGVRLAAVIDKKLVVASVVRTNDSVAIRSPRELQRDVAKNVIGVDWRDQDTLAVATSDSVRPVISVPVDGFTADPYNSSNLGGMVSAVAAAPDRDVVVTDHTGMWTVSETNQVWRPLHSVPVPNARPFYPG